MGILDRLRSVVRADAHGVLDAVEDELRVLELHLRDAEEALQQERAQLDAQDLEEQRLRASRAQAAERAARLEHDVEVALDAGDDALSRYALGQLLSLQELGRRLDGRLAELGRERDTLRARLALHEGVLGELTSRVHARRAAREQGVLAAAPVPSQQVEIELLRRKRARAGEVDDAC